MTNVFFSAFGSVFIALTKVFFVAFVAGFLVKKKVISQNLIKILSRLTVNFLLPCLIFSKILIFFNPSEMQFWWLIPVIAVVMIFFGTGAGALLFIKELPAKKNMLPLSGMQNAGYLVLPLGKVLYPDQFDLFALYCFLFILGVNPLLWSVGKVLSTSQDSSSFSFKGLITPPLIANIVAIFLVITSFKNVIPAESLKYIELIGSATIPVAMFILGATLGDISLKSMPPWLDTLRIVFVKFLLLPCITVYLLYLLKIKDLYPLLANLIVIQSSSPAATGIILQVRAYGGDYQKTGSIMFASYFICMFSLPFWLAIWQAIQ